ncbi:hypothetical protein BDA99DRAFT_508419 [Phascolomyces articulosus]|uniref:Uncharacterized protein n=1 Tax=Phascolomyces articulosus TaxID=60185 RepID=A0AAD5K0R5_9FUNG|nr:hypothetical protein BDA99DRAFT_508419 [Phascolomyces articulosus]
MTKSRYHQVLCMKRKEDKKLKLYLLGNRLIVIIDGGCLVHDQHVRKFFFIIYYYLKK